jgi:NhaP-type Na+/H+ or K+/H+ antiporter
MASKSGKKASARGRNARKGGPARSGDREIKLTKHPRAQRQIGRLKSWGGLAGFVVAAWASHKNGAPFVDMAVRALLWGVISYVVVWALAVQVWRHVAIAEVRAAERRWRDHKQQLDAQRLEAIAQARADAEVRRAAARS